MAALQESAPIPTPTSTASEAGLKPKLEPAAEGPSTAPIEAYFKLDFDDFSYYLQTLSVTIGRRVQALPTTPPEFPSLDSPTFRSSSGPTSSALDPTSTSSLGLSHDASTVSPVTVSFSTGLQTSQTTVPNGVELNAVPTDPSTQSPQVSSFSDRPNASLLPIDLPSVVSAPTSPNPTPPALPSHDPTGESSQTLAPEGDNSTHGIDVDLGPIKSVSRLHAKIVYDDDESVFVLEVLGRNGVWIDDEYVGQGQRANLGERTKIQISIRTFHFVLPSAPTSVPAPSTETLPPPPDSSPLTVVSAFSIKGEHPTPSASSMMSLDTPRSQAPRRLSTNTIEGRGGSDSDESMRSRASRLTKGSSHRGRRESRSRSRSRSRSTSRGREGVVAGNGGRGKMPKRSYSSSSSSSSSSSGSGSSSSSSSGDEETRSLVSSRDPPSIVSSRRLSSTSTRFSHRSDSDSDGSDLLSSSRPTPRAGIGKGKAAMPPRSSYASSSSIPAPGRGKGRIIPKIKLKATLPSYSTSIASTSFLVPLTPADILNNKQPTRLLAPTTAGTGVGKGKGREAMSASYREEEAEASSRPGPVGKQPRRTSDVGAAEVPGRVGGKAPKSQKTLSETSFTTSLPPQKKPKSTTSTTIRLPTSTTVTTSTTNKSPSKPIASPFKVSSLVKQSPAQPTTSAPPLPPSISPNQAIPASLIPPNGVIPPPSDPPKPPLTYTSVIYLSLQSLKKGTYQDICEWVKREFEWFRVNSSCGWENSLRHNLSTNKSFIKHPLPPDVPKTTPHVFELDPKAEENLAERAAREIKAKLNKNEKLRRQREKEIRQAENEQLAKERAEKVKRDAEEKAAKMTATGPPPLPPLPTLTMTAKPAMPPLPSLSKPSPSLLGQTPAVTRPPNAPPAPPRPFGPPGSQPIRPLHSGPISTSVPIIVAPIPAAARNNAALGSASPALADSQPIVLHEGTLILNPTIFSTLSSEQLDHLRSLPSQQALQILQTYVVQHLKKKMAAQGVKPPATAAGKPSVAGAVAKPPVAGGSARPPAMAAARPPGTAGSKAAAARPPTVPAPGAARPPSGAGRPTAAFGSLLSSSTPTASASTSAHPSLTTAPPNSLPPADPIAALAALAARPDGTPGAPGLASLGPHGPALLQYLSHVGAKATMETAALIIKTGRAPGVPLYVPQSRPPPGTAAAARQPIASSFSSTPSTAARPSPSRPPLAPAPGPRPPLVVAGASTSTSTSTSVRPQPPPLPNLPTTSSKPNPFAPKSTSTPIPAPALAPPKPAPIHPTVGGKKPKPKATLLGLPPPSSRVTSPNTKPPLPPSSTSATSPAAASSSTTPARLTAGKAPPPPSGKAPAKKAGAGAKRKMGDKEDGGDGGKEQKKGKKAKVEAG